MKILSKLECLFKRKQSSDIPETKNQSNEEQVNSVLLRTYFTSLLSFILCITMFFGTSYAWFTSEVNNTVNEIYVGTLDVGLLKETSDGMEDLATGTAKLFNKNIRWEPGYTALETIQIVNKGDLAFHYVLAFTDGNLEVGERVSLEAIADCFDVWVFEYRNKIYSDPTSYNDILTNQDWTYVGSLQEVLNGDKLVLSGKMVTVRNEDLSADAANEGTTDGVDTTDRYTIALHMKENAGAELMGHKISLNVKLVAYQWTAEHDGFGNNEYDDNLVLVRDAEELKSACANGKDPLLINDIIIPTADDCITMNGNMMDGNSLKIIYEGEAVDGKSVGVVTTNGGTISNLTIQGGKYGRALYMTELKTDLLVNNCTLSGEFSFNLNSSKMNEDAIISFFNTTFENTTSYANAAKHAYFTDCVFNHILRPYGDTTITNCTFANEGIDVSELAKTKAVNETVTLINCTYMGRAIEKAVLVSTGNGVVVAETDLITVDANNRVVLNGIG